MKRILVATIVGAVILFLCQFLSWAALNLHSKAQEYTPQQENILTFLKSQNLQEGGYILPSSPPNTSMEQQNALMKAADGKPWASIQYHNSLQTAMAPNMIRTVLVNIVLLLGVCWLMVRLRTQNFSSIFLATAMVGLIGFLNFSYVYHIWYKSFDLWGSLAETVISWGLVGVWLGWWLTKTSIKGEPAVEPRTTFIPVTEKV